MKVNEYIYRNWANWNFAILKELCEDEGIEWSEELVAYLKDSPGNTNWNLLVDFGIEPYGADEEEESGAVYCIEIQGYGPVYDFTKTQEGPRGEILYAQAFVRKPELLLNKWVDIYYDTENDDRLINIPESDGIRYYCGFRITSLTEATSTQIDGSQNYTVYSCEMRTSKDGEVDSAAVWISEPYDEESKVTDEGVIHYPGIIKFDPGEPQE